MKSIKKVIVSLLGGIVSLIPLLVIYLLSNWLLPTLCFLIPLIIYFGLKKITQTNKTTIIYVIATSLIMLALAFLIFIPALVLYKERNNISINNIMALYQKIEFKTDITYNLFISSIFVIIGMVLTDIKIKLNLKKQEPENEIPEDIKQEIINIFIENNAVNKKKSIEKEKLKEIELDEVKKECFEKLQEQYIITKYNDRYYYNEKYERYPVLRVILDIIKILITVFIFIGIIYVTINY